MKATLLVVTGNTTKRKVALVLPCVLGRSPAADITVPHTLISRKHCELSDENGLLMLRDLASLNGTMIGGRKIASAPLLPGGEFTIGPLTFRVIYEFHGDLESLPPVSYADEAVAEAELDEPAIDEAGAAAEFDEQAAPSLSHAELDMSEFNELADADPEAIAGELPAAADESPWSVVEPPAPAPQAVPKTAAKAPKGAELPAAPGATNPPATKVKPPIPDDDADAEFGSFLEDLH